MQYGCLVGLVLFEDVARFETNFFQDDGHGAKPRKSHLKHIQANKSRKP